jgi:hypothetical protein
MATHTSCVKAKCNPKHSEAKGPVDSAMAYRPDQAMEGARYKSADSALAAVIARPRVVTGASVPMSRRAAHPGHSNARKSVAISRYRRRAGSRFPNDREDLTQRMQHFVDRDAVRSHQPTDQE